MEIQIKCESPSELEATMRVVTRVVRDALVVGLKEKVLEEQARATTFACAYASAVQLARDVMAQRDAVLRRNARQREIVAAYATEIGAEHDRLRQSEAPVRLLSGRLEDAKSSGEQIIEKMVGSWLNGSHGRA